MRPLGDQAGSAAFLATRCRSLPSTPTTHTKRSRSRNEYSQAAFVSYANLLPPGDQEGDASRPALPVGTRVRPDPSARTM